MDNNLVASIYRTLEKEVNQECATNYIRHVRSYLAKEGIHIESICMDLQISWMTVYWVSQLKSKITTFPYDMGYILSISSSEDEYIYRFKKLIVPYLRELMILPDNRISLPKVPKHNGVYDCIVNTPTLKEAFA